jgi:ATP-dependent helicase/nuclease subunit B
MRFIQSDSSIYKTKKIYEEIISAQKSGEENLLLIVPEQATVSTEKQLVKYGELKGLMGIEVLSITRLVYRVLSETGGINRTKLNEQGKLIILFKILQDNKNKLTAYKKITQSFGLVENINSLIIELKNGCITTEKLDNINKKEMSPLVSEKISDVRLIYKEYEKYLGNDIVDNETQKELLISLIPESKLIENSKFWFDGFNTFSELDTELLMILNSYAVDVTFGLHLDNNINRRNIELFNVIQKTKNKITRAGINNGGEMQTVFRRNTEIKKKELQFFDNNYSSYTGEKYKGETDLMEIFQCKNTKNEIEILAQNIIENVRNKELRWRDVLVITNDFDEYESLINRIFRIYNIPYFMDKKWNLTDNQLTKTILCLIKIITNNYRKEDIISFIKTGFSLINEESIYYLENYLIEFNINGKKRWETPFVYESNDKECIIEEINEIRNKLFLIFSGFEEKFTGSETYSGKTEALYYWIEDNNIWEQINQLINLFEEKMNYKQVNVYSQLQKIFYQIFDQIVEALGDEKVGNKDYYKILETCIKAYEIGVIPSSIDQVSVGDLKRSRYAGAKIIFLIGVNEGVIPKSFEQQGLFTENEREDLRKQGINLTDKVMETEEEQYIIFQLFSQIEEKLVMSFSLSDMEGKTKNQSALIDEITGLFPELKINSTVSENIITQWKSVSTPESTLAPMTDYIKKSNSGFSELSENEILLWESVISWYKEKESGGEKLHKIYSGINAKNNKLNIQNQFAQLIYGSPFKGSISQLEKYQQCPFSHFIRYGIKPRDRKEFRIAPVDIGGITHTVLQQFCEEVHNRNLKWDDVNETLQEELLNLIISEVIYNYHFNIFYSSFQYRYMIKKLSRVLKSTVKTLVFQLQQGDFDWKYSEEKFRIKYKSSNNTEIILRGAIDRIDVLEKGNETYYRVIDYKTGNTSLKLAKVFHGLSLQLLVYLNAMIEGKEGHHPAGTFYFRVDDPVIKTDLPSNEEKIRESINNELKLRGLILNDIEIIESMDHNIGNSSAVIPVKYNKDGSPRKSDNILARTEFKQLLEYINQQTVDISEEILEGNIKAEPRKFASEDLPCKYCDYKSICRFDKKVKGFNQKYLKNMSKEQMFQKINDKGEKTDA